MPAVNTFANVQSKAGWVVMDVLTLLKHKLKVAKYMRTDYIREFQKEFAVGDTVQVKYPWRPVLRDGLTYTPQNIERITTQIKVDQIVGTDYEWGTVDKLLNMERGDERVRKDYNVPAATYIAAEIDRRAAQFAGQNAGFVTGGALGTNPSTFDATSASARARFVEQDMPEEGEKAILIPPQVNRAIKGGSDGNLARFGPMNDIKTLFRKGVIGVADDFDWFESMSLYRHTTGSWATTLTLASAVANGATSLSITTTVGDVFKKGDKLGLGVVFPVNPVTRQRTQSTATYMVSVAADVTATSTTTTVQINETINFSGAYQNVDSQPANGATVTPWPGTTFSASTAKVGNLGLALHEDACAFVTLPLPIPKREEVAAVQTDPETGLSLALIQFFDGRTRTWGTRWDCAFGFGRLHAEPGIAVIPCA